MAVGFRSNGSGSRVSHLAALLAGDDVDDGGDGSGVDCEGATVVLGDEGVEAELRRVEASSVARWRATKRPGDPVIPRRSWLQRRSTVVVDVHVVLGC